MGRRSCCVPTCFRSSRILYCFPNPDIDLQRFKLWVALSGNQEIQASEPHQVHNWRRICRHHFKECFILSNNMLRSDAFPTELLSIRSIEEEEDIDMAEEDIDMAEEDIDMVQEEDETECNILPTSEASPAEEFHGPSASTFEQDADEEMAVCSTPPRLDAIPEAFYGPSTSSFGLEPSEQASKLTATKSSKASLLRTVNVSRAAQLTPKAKLMYKEAVNLKRQLRTSKIRHAACKKRLEYAENCSKTELFTSSSSAIMQKIVSRFFKSQLENASKKPKGKRFTEDDKVLALALFKQSGPAYRFLSDIFSLPSRHTLTNYLNKIPMHPGINEYVFEVLASQVESIKKDTGKYCILLFDEMSICPNFSYDLKRDIVLGFEDFGDRRTQKIANHVQVFMVRNIEAKWKQPIYYNFVNGATHHSEIERILKLLITKLAEIGLIVCATVCDQGTNNVAAIKNLVNDTRADYLRREEEMRGTFFEIADTVVVPLFDPPHLLKGIRNNLLTKDLKCTIDGVDQIAKWEDIHKAYLIDPKYESMRMIPKLTDFHVVPNLIKKMKVSTCSQVFSHAVSLAIHVMATDEATYECNGEMLKMKPRAKQTAKVIDFFDKLFDSVNGHVEVEVQGKNLRTCVTDNSEHIAFWKRAIQIFKTMVYIEKDDNDDSASDTDDTNRNERPKKKFTPPTITNWITTLEGFIAIYSNLKGVGFKNMFPRTFNQDPLENFFGQVRQRGVRFTNPTVAAFTPFYKSLLVNNYSKGHSQGSNCENDEGDILVSLKRFVQQDVVEVQPVLHSNEDMKITEMLENLKDLKATVLPDLKGLVSKTVVPKVRNCEGCKRNIFGEGVEKRRMKNCSSLFIDYFTKIHYIFDHIFPIIGHLGNIMQRIATIIQENVVFPFTDDCGHGKDIQDLVIKSFTRILLLHEVKTLNNIMLGKDRRNIDKAKADSIIYKNAADIFKKSRKKENK